LDKEFTVSDGLCHKQIRPHIRDASIVCRVPQKPLDASFLSSILGLETYKNINRISKEESIATLLAGYGTINSVLVAISPGRERIYLILKQLSEKRHLKF